MKRLSLFIVLMLLYVSQYAQIEKGTYVPSISLNGTYSNSLFKDTISSNKNNSWKAGLNLGFGKFIKDNLLLTYYLGYSNTHTKTTYDYTNYYYNGYTNSNIGNGINAGLSLSKYKFINENFAVTFGPSALFVFGDGLSTNTGYKKYFDSNNNPYYVSYTSSTYQNSINIQIYLLAGIQYFISKNIALVGSMGAFSADYITSPYLKEKKHTEQNNFNFSLTPSFNAFSVGLIYFIRPKEKL